MNGKYSRVFRATIIRRKSFKPPYRNHVTASKLPAFAHQDDFATAGVTAMRVFAHKEMPEPNSFSYQAIDHGNKYESHGASFIRQCSFFQRFNFEYPENDGIWSITGTWMNNERKKAFMFSATPDMLIQDQKGIMHPVEIKCPFRSWSLGLELTSAYIKTSHWIQLMAQMLLTGSKRGYLCIYMPPRDPLLEQAIVWEVKWTRAAENFILDLIDETYEKIHKCEVDNDFKKLFRAKNGQKEETRSFIEGQLKNQSKVVFRLNC